MLKKTFIFVVCLVPWFLSVVFPIDYDYFKEISLPFFAPPGIFYGIAWTLIYILIAITIYKIIMAYNIKDISLSYKLSLIINYLFNQSFTIVFFGLKNNFLGFISCLGTFVSALFLYQETSNLKDKIAKFLDPYVVFSLFATILSLTIYVMNSL